VPRSKKVEEPTDEIEVDDDLEDDDDEGEDLDEDQLAAELDDADLDPEDLDEDDLDDSLDADFDEDEDDADEDDSDSDSDADEDEEEEDEADASDEEDEDGPSSLDQLLEKRSALRSGTDDSDDDDEILALADDTLAPAKGGVKAPVIPLRDREEFVCRSCFLVKRRSQLADPEKQLCRDCV
jgi:Domain of unknown function (DUF4193)